MFRLVIAVMLIAAGIIGFSMFTLPLYKEIGTLKIQAASFNEALGNAKALENERDKLTAKENAISLENKEKIKKLLPDNVDNVRLILEIGQIALPFGMELKDVRYDTFTKPTVVSTPTSTSTSTPTPTAAINPNNKSYGIWNLEFSTQGTYNTFLDFVKSLESNLRVVDISSISFSSDTGSTVNPNFIEAYKYGFKIKTYWLRN